jgi:competence ComEA-like helix-hairpin-helix protein
MKRIIKDYFTFSKKERRALVILLLLIVAFIAIPYFYAPKFKPPMVNKVLVDFLKKNKAVVSTAESTGENNSTAYSSAISKNVKPETFAFDPNTVSEKDWQRLGISDKTIRTIVNYRSKGGKFRQPEDLSRIWGFKKEDAERLLPFVRIQNTDVIKDGRPKSNYQSQQPGTSKHPHTIDINTASVEEWKDLPGIGEVLANRIINFRSRTGGFTSIEQVRKTYGISDSVFGLISPYLTLTNLTPAIHSNPKININTASAYEWQLKANIPDAIAKAIVVYRKQYGSFQSVADLKKIVFISDTLFERIVGKLTVER